MKNKLFITLALSFLFSCSDYSDDETLYSYCIIGNQCHDGPFTISSCSGQVSNSCSNSGPIVTDNNETFSKVYTNVVDENGDPYVGTLDFSYSDYFVLDDNGDIGIKFGSLSSFGTGIWEAKVTDNKLSLKLGTPYDSKLLEYLEYFQEARLFVPIPPFYTQDRKKQLLCKYEWSDESSFEVSIADFIYVDRDVPYYEEDGFSIQELKKGWNQAGWKDNTKCYVTDVTE